MISQSSYILPEEIDEAKKFVKEKLGFEPPKVPGNLMAVKVFVRDEDICITTVDGKEIRIVVPETVSTADVFRSCVALVLAQGPDCYSGDEYKECGPYCRVGDWIWIPRNEGLQENYCGVPMQFIEDNKMYGVLESPHHLYKLEGA